LHSVAMLPRKPNDVPMYLNTNDVPLSDHYITLLLLTVNHN